LSCGEAAAAPFPGVLYSTRVLTLLDAVLRGCRHFESCSITQTTQTTAIDFSVNSNKKTKQKKQKNKEEQ
jgi:hypothetical protein